jgi:flagellar basal-body rod modification protein FlgD
MSAITAQVATTDFLQLLTIQLQNQDPIDPVKQEDFISQLSQFSLLEGMEELNSNFGQLLETQQTNQAQLLEVQQFNQGVNLVGKEARYTDPKTGNETSGTVDQLLLDNGTTGLLIAGERIALDVVSGILA